ncbi:unnamed protein product [Closterium sp. NIES-65]|nr:unnamed protein product [Closterium sp. NIES-65]
MIRECPLLSDRRTRVIYGRGDMEEGEEGEVGMEGAEGFATGEEGDPDGEESEEDEEEEADSDGEDDDDDQDDGNDDDDQDDGNDDDEEEEETEDSAEGEGEGDESEEGARQRQLARAASLAVSSATSSAAPSIAAFGSRSFGIGSPSPISAWQAHLLPRVFNVASSSPQPTAVVGNAHSTLSPSLLRSPSPSAPLLQPGMIALRTRSPLIPSSSLISSHGLATSATSTPAAAATSATSTPAAAATSATSTPAAAATSATSTPAAAVTPASSTSASPPSTSAAAGAEGAVSTGGVGVAAAGEPGVGNGRIRVKTKALTKQAKHIMNILDAEATGVLREQRNMPDFKPGDVLSMKIEVPENKRRTSIVKGIVIARRNAGIGSTFRIRRMLAGVGVEMSFPLYSPNIKEITVIGTRKASVCHALATQSVPPFPCPPSQQNLQGSTDGGDGASSC